MLLHEIAVYDDNDNEYLVEFEYSASYDPGYSYGPIENHTPPDEDHDYNILTITDPVGRDVTEELENHEFITNPVNEWVIDNGLEAIKEYNSECYAESVMASRDMGDYYYGP